MFSLNEFSLLSIFAALSVYLPLCIGLGYFIASFFDHPEGHFSITDSIPGSLLGVHALLIGFTFSMAVQRYDQRRDLVVKEANAIGTAYLRSQTLAEPERKLIAEKFKQYVNLKIEFGKLNAASEGIDSHLNQVDSLQAELWNLGQQTVKKNRGPLEAIFLQSLNEVIDVHAERVHALKNQLPVMVVILLMVTLTLALVSLGFVEAVKERRSFFWLIMLTITFATVITLILDLDRPRRGLIQVDQSPIQGLQKLVQEAK